MSRGSPREWFSLDSYIGGTENAMNNATAVVAEADADLAKALDELSVLSLQQEVFVDLQGAIALLVRARARLVEVGDHAKETRFCVVGARAHLEGGDIAESEGAS